MSDVEAWECASCGEIRQMRAGSGPPSPEGCEYGNHTWTWKLISE